MKFTAFCSVVLLIGFAQFVCSQDDTTTTVSTDTTTTEQSTTPPPITPPTTTELPTTTTELPTTTETPTPTEPPTTTTQSTTSSTAAPTTTTTSSTTTSTTARPTTTPRPTTSPSPVTPIPEPKEARFNVTEGNVTCIMVDLKIRFKINVENDVSYETLSPNAIQSGSCEGFNGTQELRLRDTEVGSAGTLTFVFAKEDNSVFIQNITLEVPQISGLMYNDSRLLAVKSGNSYLCKSNTDIPLGNVTMQVQYIHAEAFKTAGSEEFSIAEECQADDKLGDVVPIAVGCALLGLVVVVLIAYLVGRRRNRQKGYQSV